MPLLKLTAATLSAVLFVGAGSVALGQSGDTVSVDVSVDEASTRLAAAEDDVVDLRGQLTELQLERSEFGRRLAQRDARREQAALDLREARARAQRLAVQAYIGAGSAPSAETIAYADLDPLDYTFRATLLEDSTNARYRAATYYQDLRDQASDAVAATVEHLDDLDETITVTRLGLGLAEDAQRTAAVVRAVAEAAQRAALQAAELVSLGVGGPPADGSFVPLGEWPGGPSYAQWSALRQCESSGNYRAVSPSGLYRGAYQFDLGTWATVGGSGDPINASPAEQDHRAQVLWSQRGASPWPICGRYLS